MCIEVIYRQIQKSTAQELPFDVQSTSVDNRKEFACGNS